MKHAHYLFILFFVIPVLFIQNQNCVNNLEFGEYLPDYLSEITYPEHSKLVTYNLPEGKQLLYLSANHTDDFDSIERQTIKKLIANERPDLCILEGFETIEGINPDRIIELSNEYYPQKIGGENTYAAYIAHQEGISFIGGEINNDDLLKGLLSCNYTKKDIVFYMLIQQIPYWDRDGLLDIENPKQQFEQFMHNQVASWYKMEVTYTYEEFLSWFREHYKKKYHHTDWTWAVARQYSWTDKREGSFIHQQIGADNMNLRDNHIISVIKQSIEKYNKILVIFGSGNKGSHYVWEKEALEALFGIPDEIELVQEC